MDRYDFVDFWSILNDIDEIENKLLDAEELGNLAIYTVSPY